MSTPSRVVNVLDEDRNLAQHVPASRLEEARREAVARLVLVQPGEWAVPPEKARDAAGGLGLLVLDGMLVRNVSMSGRPGVELFGAGDLVRPCQTADSQAAVPAEVRWWALSLTRLAVLNGRFTSRMCGYPEVIDELGGRLERRSSAHALRFAILQHPRLAERLHLLLWHLADRFGQVHSEGAVLAVPLSHELLSQLVGARRPSVSRALKELERAELLARRPNGAWLLARQPLLRKET